MLRLLNSSARVSPVRSLAAAFHQSAFVSAYPLGKSGKPLSSYLRYFKEVRDEVLAASPDLKTTEVAKKIGEKWRALSETDRERYKQEYKKAFEEFSSKR